MSKYPIQHTVDVCTQDTKHAFYGRQQRQQEWWLVTCWRMWTRWKWSVAKKVCIYGGKSPSHLQVISKRLSPGCVKLHEKIAFCLPSAGRKTQFSHFTFTKPGKRPVRDSLLSFPSNWIEPRWQQRNMRYKILPTYQQNQKRWSQWSVLNIFPPSSESTFGVLCCHHCHGISHSHISGVISTPASH